MSCIQTGLETSHLNDRISKALGLKTGFFIAIDTGIQCTYSGSGLMYEAYKATGKITNHTGFGKKPSNFYDIDFDTAEFRYIEFDETFAGSPYDCCKSNCVTFVSK